MFQAYRLSVPIYEVEVEGVLTFVRLGSRIKCNNCDKFGHRAKRCPEHVVETTGNDWSNDFDLGAVPESWAKSGDNFGAAGSWSETPQESTGNWADDTIAAAEGNY